MFKLNFWNLCFDIWLAMYVSGHWKDSTTVRGLGTPVACYSFIFIYYSNGRPTHMPCVDTYYTSSMQLDFTTSVKSGGVVKYGGWFAKRRASIILHNTSPHGQHNIVDRYILNYKQTRIYQQWSTLNLLQTKWFINSDPSLYMLETRGFINSGLPYTC